MNGQAKVWIPVAIGIITLLLTGITGILMVPGEQQAIQIAETRAITLEDQSRQALTSAFHDGAEAAALETELSVEADLVVELKHSPLVLVSMSEGVKSSGSSN